MVKRLVKYLFHKIYTIGRLEDIRINNEKKIKLLSQISEIESSVWLSEDSAISNNSRKKNKIKIGANSRVMGQLFLFDSGGEIIIGKDCHIGERCYLWAGNNLGKIILGNGVSLAPEVFITASNYQFSKNFPFRDQICKEKNVRIGSDVWLGARVVVTAGVFIGDGCIVGAGAVVTKNLPPRSIAVGIPARVISYRK